MPPRLSVKTNAVPAGARPGLKTNAVPAVRGAGGTNAVPAVKAGGTNAVSKLTQTFNRVSANRAFYPTVIGVAVCLGVFFLYRAFGSKSSEEKSSATSTASSSGPLPKASKKKVTIHACNVLQSGGSNPRLFQFNVRGGHFVFDKEQAAESDKPLPAGAVAKDWRALYQRKLNVAWLPPEQVFLRVAQFPQSDFEETRAMVELQLEKLSPMPVTQIVWSIQVMPQGAGDLQTVIVIIVSRNLVEEFLGKLEGQGFMADRLELPLLDQLQATTVRTDGAWIYPVPSGISQSAVVAWWYGGILRNLDLITMPPGNRPTALKEQLLQMAWAGEMEGWLDSAPAWHLVADAAEVAIWESPLRTSLEQPLDLLPAKPGPELAGLTAARAARSEAGSNLLPLEYITRYHGQWVDRLWMGSLGAVIGLYVIGVVIYFIALNIADYRTSSVEQQIAGLALDYTNTIQLKQKYAILKDRQELKFASLQCWQRLAELLPEGVNLDGFNFADGRRLSLNGTAPADHVQELYKFEEGMRKAKDEWGQVMFDSARSENLVYRSNPGAATVSWNVSFELNRSEATQ
jgi:hypothetical protein